MIVDNLFGQYVGFIFDQSDDTLHHTGTLVIEPHQMTLEIPLLRSVTDAYAAWFENQANVPTELYLRNDKHNFYMTGLRFQNRQTLLALGHGSGRLTVERVVRTGPRTASFKLMNKLRSDLIGLPGWAGGSSINLGIENNPETGRIDSITIEGHSQPATLVRDIPELSLAPHFHYRSDKANQRFEISQTVNVETSFDEPTEWETHARLHRAIQDLVSIAFWHPCNLQALDALHQDDPTVSVSGNVLGIEWRQMFTPDFGRRTVGEPVKPLAENRRPLFTFSDIGAEGVSRWWSEYDDLGKAMWVLAASLFRSGGTVEVRLLQVATALEALGYHLATSNTQRRANFEATIQRVIDKTDCDLEQKVLKGRTPEQWAADFNTAYKGVKHADNPLPDSLDAYNCAAQGEWLARLWLARHLGMERSALDERLSSL